LKNVISAGSYNSSKPTSVCSTIDHWRKRHQRLFSTSHLYEMSF